MQLQRSKPRPFRMRHAAVRRFNIGRIAWLMRTYTFQTQTSNANRMFGFQQSARAGSKTIDIAEETD